MRSFRPLSLLTSLVLGVAVVAPASPATAAGATLTILTPEADQTVSGDFTVTFEVVPEAGSQQTSYRAQVDDQVVSSTFASCSTRCTFTFTVKSTQNSGAGQFPGPGGQVDDGPQQISIRAFSGSVLMGTASRGIVVDNHRPIVTVTAPPVPAGAVDGRPTVDTSVRISAVPAAAGPGASVTAVVAYLGGEPLSATPPATPGGAWVFSAATSQRSAGPASIDVSATDDRGLRSAWVRIPVMVDHGATLSSQPWDAPVYDDSLGAVTLDYSFGRSVTDTWPTRVDVLVDDVRVDRRSLTRADHDAHPGVIWTGVPPLLSVGERKVTFVVTDNRGVTSRFERVVLAVASTQFTWLSGAGASVQVGRPVTLKASASTSYGQLASWYLFDATTNDVLTAGTCTAQPCPTSQILSTTFTPRAAGQLRVRWELTLTPTPRTSRSLTTTLTVLPAPNDFTGDRFPDVLARTKAGQLMLYRGNGKGGWQAPGGVIGTGWQGFTSIVSNGDNTGDFTRDVLARDGKGQVWVYAANGKGGWQGRGEPLNLVLPGYTIVSGLGDFNGDRHPDLIARDGAGRLWLHTTGSSARTQIGSGWQGFTALFSPGDFDGDGASDVLARSSDGRLLLYSGNGKGGWASAGRQIGSGWSGFTALSGVGDFSGDGHADVVARTKAGQLVLYRGNGKGGWLSALTVGSGWQDFTTIVGVG